MSTENKPGFLCHFDELEDPRIDRKKLYPLTEILFIGKSKDSKITDS